MESILSLLKNCMVFLRIIPVKKVDEVHRIVYNTESAERISVTVHTGVNSKGKAITYDNNTNCVRLSYDSFPLFCSFNQKPPLLSAPHGK